MNETMKPQPVPGAENQPIDKVVRIFDLKPTIKERPPEVLTKEQEFVRKWGV